ncbi:MULTISPECIES: ogr/Delta-like zinc finger family protein [Sphingomonas]|uniref:ogr/Delta-like zinc finger family protein n=1 Tax=Sphingomonas TaxID=13687 RepID=UPI000F7D8260|nr:ogr/Delta-like zinc finger family protein [Sphingomonas sp. ABOLF]RSV16271.1 transcriptional regulator [Sphingomonas sp. ABOLF]GLK21469.1 hypothetical protein GCM10017606_22950 [Microbacterium terregens]
MSRTARPRQPSFDCPHCRSRAIVRSSAQVTSLVRELDYACTNHRCGHTFVAQLEAVRTIVPSATPSAAVHLPFGNRNLGPKRLPVPANDDTREPANEDGPSAAQAPDPMSG